jgi:hypothetical protein
VPEEIAVKMSEKLTGKEVEKGRKQLSTPLFSHISSSETSVYANNSRDSELLVFIFL